MACHLFDGFVNCFLIGWSTVWWVRKLTSDWLINTLMGLSCLSNRNSLQSITCSNMLHFFELSFLLHSYFQWNTLFFGSRAHARISAQDLFFMVRGGMASATVIKQLVKLSPRRSKKSEITYLSSCRVCKPALNSAISAVPSLSHYSYSPHDRSIDQLTIFSHAG